MSFLTSLFTIVFGRRTREIKAAPPGVQWRSVRQGPSTKPVRAWLAERDGKLRKRDASLKYKARRDMLVEYAPGDVAPVRRDIFEATYRRRSDGLYEKRADITYRFFTLPYRVIVRTMEGGKPADAGDWIMQGVEGELWPVPRARAEQEYMPI